MTSCAWANVYSLPADGGRLIGRIQHHEVQKGEYFKTIADHYNIGILELMESNPGVDPFLPTPGTELMIPTQMLIPDVVRKGVVINLAELRLYYFPKHQREVHVFPIGIGKIGWDTPEMTTTISSRIENPTWTPPKSIRKAYLEEKGIVLPPVVPAGPDNPLGNHALRLAYGYGSYLIHGTNKDFGIGMRVSSGCVRLNPKDIAWLFEQTRRGEPVRIINRTIKISAEPNGEKWIEVHSPLSETENDSQVQKALKLTSDIVRFISDADIDNQKANDALLSQRGLPVNIRW
ncbi:L,D-transpeptidase family protein [Shewanella gelidii]|nr:L,D-transpeptidase family protein [Shewanella gelidii]MCL1096714.1 L,D-transpeptidase family protein [Shewanella gelidii]